MDKNTSNEVLETVKELREFSKACLNVAAWVESCKAKIMQWENIRENAEMLARQAQHDLDEKRANLQLELQRLPNELAPLRNKIAQEQNDAQRLMGEAVLARKEANALLEKVKAINSEVNKEEAVTASDVVAVQAKRPGRPRKESVTK